MEQKPQSKKSYDSVNETKHDIRGSRRIDPLNLTLAEGDDKDEQIKYEETILYEVENINTTMKFEGNESQEWQQ